MFIAIMKPTVDNLPQKFSNCELSVNQHVHSMTKIVSVTQYVFLIILKCFNIYELDYALISFVGSAVRFQKEPIHMLFWLAVD